MIASIALRVLPLHLMCDLNVICSYLHTKTLSTYHGLARNEALQSFIILLKDEEEKKQANGNSLSG
jgi:hypothetical protein